MYKKNKIYDNIFIGIILSFAGTIFLIKELLNLKFTIWPIFLVLIGFFLFYIHFYKRKISFALLVGVLLTFAGIYFLILDILGWRFINKSWPVLILIVSSGFYVYYLEAKNKDFLYTANVLIILFALLIIIINFKNNLWPLTLLIIGLFLIFNNLYKLSKIKNSTTINNPDNKEE